ncbi:hypothetical protein UlMin_001548 [Ulmus minor]
MYKDLREQFWWPGMKKEVAEYVAKCITCQKVKAEHQRPGGLPKTTKSHDAIWVVIDRLTKSAHFIPIRTTFSLEQLAELYQATIGMAPYEALYGRKCRSPVHWYETGEAIITAPEFVENTTNSVKKIQTRMKSAQSC